MITRMTGNIRKFACMTLLAALAACATAGPEDSRKLADTAYFAADFSCTRAEAANLDFAALEAHPERYANKCIRTDVFSDGVWLYASAGVMQADRNGPFHLRLGATWKNQDLRQRLSIGPSFVTVTGRVRDCVARKTHTPAADAPACEGLAAIFVSEAQIVPTAMD
jgi:hypothetical protein